MHWLWEVTDTHDFLQCWHSQIQLLTVLVSAKKTFLLHANLAHTFINATEPKHSARLCPIARLVVLAVCTTSVSAVAMAFIDINLKPNARTAGLNDHRRCTTTITAYTESL